MKTLAKSLFVSFAIALYLLIVNQCYAPPLAVTITVDENGGGSIDFGAGPVPLAALMLADPGPLGLPSALTYVGLPFPGVIGDVLLIEPGDTEPSDLIRFNGDGTLVFYSDGAAPSAPVDGDADLADTGLPGATYPNFVAILELGPEGNNGATYTPLPGQPGFDPVYLPTFNFISDIPEPGSMTLVGLAVVGLLVIKRRKN